MSADNGIYLLQSLARNGGHEYRVIHAQAIDNIYWWDDKHESTNEINPKYLIQYFGNCKVLNEEEATEEADSLYEHHTEDGGFIEYGICTIEYNDEFPRAVDLVD